MDVPLTSELSEFKTARANAKRALTRAVNSIRQLIAEDELDTLSDKVTSLKQLFHNFQLAHDAYHEVLSDDDDIDVSDKYFISEQNKYIKTLEVSKKFLPNTTSSANNSFVSTPEDAARISVPELMGVFNMPKVELEMFNGDPMRYHEFIQSFDLNVDCLSSDSNMKLTRLLQYTTGRAKDAIRSCLLIGGDNGYTQARSILEERFGNAYLVAEHVMRDLRQSKPAKSPREIRQLADDLENARMVLEKLQMINEINSQSMIMDIVSRFPFYIQNRWKQRSLESKKLHGKYLDFNGLCKFASSEASDANDPIYGNFNVKKADKVKPNVSAAASMLAPGTNASHSAPAMTSRVTRPYARPEAPCVLCGVCHRLWHCERFRKLSPKERLKIVEDNKLCHNCLLASHATSQCGKNSVCSVQGCGEKHTMYIHVEQRNDHATVDVKMTNAGSDAKTFMPIVQVLAGGVTRAFALLDTASSNSFCSKRLADALHLDGQMSEYRLSTLGGIKMVKSEMVNISLSSVDAHQNELDMSGIFVVKSIPVKNSPIDLQQYDHLKDIDLPAACGPVDVDLLIGQDYSEAFMPLDVRSGKNGEPFAVRTLFGWCMNGKDMTTTVSRCAVSNFICMAQPDSTYDDISRLWHMENDGLTLDETCWSQQDKAVVNLWDNECRLTDGHYELPIPWKDKTEPLPNNFVLAMSRLNSTMKKLQKQNILERYETEIELMLSKGYAEIVPADDIHNAGRIWYLPHHAVITEKKPDKLRIVFDCASSFQGRSLNERCMQGPDLINKLLYVLLRFRLHTYAIQADIESMYHQIRIPPKDRDALRFLWYRDGELCYFRMTSHLFGGVWCASSSAYALKRTVQDNPECDELVQDTIDNSFYVDDCLKSIATEDEAVNVVRETPKILQKGGFNLTKFVANKAEILREVPDDHRAKEVRDFCPDTQSKVLGLKWKVMPDVFVFDVHVPTSEVITRRKMLSIASAIFDPLGLLNPAILQGKLLLQDVTRLKLQWDDLVPEFIKQQWEIWLTSLRYLTDVKIPRCIKPREFDSDCIRELHHFSDGSERAYGACSYLRCINDRGLIHTQLIMSKCKVAPIKQQSIPRLELQGAVLAAKMNNLLLHQLGIDIDGSFFWCDSEIVLKYIKNETKRFHVFVANRIRQIREVSEPDQWHYIPSELNPADKLTRVGGKIDDTWSTGPDFLRTYKCEWPDKRPVSTELSENDVEVKSEVCVNVYVTAANDLCTKIMTHYSSWYKMQRALAWWFRFRCILLKKDSPRGHLTVNEINDAKQFLLKYVQRQCYAEEIDCLKSGKSVKKSSNIISLQPYLDDNGLLRVGGRLSSLQDSKMHPCILSASCAVSAAIVRDVHSKAHVGTEWTLALIREDFWITKARSLVKRIIKACVMCKKMFARPCAQKMSDLPRERIEPYKPPFTNVGLDIFGPYVVKNYRSEIKRFGCVFTCMITRAIHIEKLKSLETDSFLNGFRRFIARRGVPNTVFSDNGTSFVGADNEMKKAFQELQSDKVQNFAVKNGIDWRFIPPCAPHMGGVWERLVGTIKRAMKAVLCTKLTDDTLETIFCEVEAIVNGRPLTKLSDNPKDHAPLTPNHILLLRQGVSEIPGKFDSHDMYRRRWRHVQFVADQFWHKWTKLYLPELQRRVKWHDSKPNLAVGDLVMITGENTPRYLWPLAVVKDIHMGRDGLVRSVRVQTKSSEIVRPVTKIVLLESAMTRA